MDLKQEIIAIVKTNRPKQVINCPEGCSFTWYYDPEDVLSDEQLVGLIIVKFWECFRE